MGSKCIDYKSFYRNGDNVVLSDYIESGFLKDHNIGASHNKTIGLVIITQQEIILIVFLMKK